MRWPIRVAKINPGLRETFERYGVGTMQVILGTTNYFHHEGRDITQREVLTELLAWLTEQHDRVELKANLSMAMEFAITVFVGYDVLPKLLHGLKGLLGW